MSSYSFHCKKCGHTVLSNDKQEVKGARALHKARSFVNPATGAPMIIPKCALTKVVTRVGHPQRFARPSLAKHLNAKVI